MVFVSRPSFGKIKLKRYLIHILVLMMTFLIGVYLYQNKRVIPIEQVFVGKIWGKPIGYLPDLKGVGTPTAKNCGSCHTEIYEEWKLSTHANALRDIQFQSELAKSSSPKWLCLNCHIPIQNQRETIVTALRGGDFFQPIEIPNPNFNPEMMEEAITCATCHVRVDTITNESYVIGASGDTSPPHPIQINRKFLHNRCNDCHNETYTLNQSLVCSFQTGTELQSSNPNGTCVSCHLPEVQRSFVKPTLNRPTRNSHRHGFIGGGVPKTFSLYKDQIRLGYKPGLVLAELKWEKDTIVIRLKNQNAGHHVTTGDPERFYRLILNGYDPSGKIVYQAETKIGQVWEWTPKAKKIKDNRIPSNEEFVWKLNPTNPSGAISRLQFQTIHVRLKDQTSEYMIQSAKHVPEPYFENVKKIKELYPHSSIVIETVYDVKLGKRIDTSLVELFKRNAERRGE